MPYKIYLKNRLNSTKFRVNGLVPSSHLPHKRQLCQAFHDHRLYSADQLPPKVDLRSDMTPVEDQSRIGSCAANSLAGAYEYLTKKANGRNTDVSRLFIYYNARIKDQKSENLTDSGCTMTSAIEALEELGTCLESIWPYDISRVNARPNEQSYQEARRHKIIEALRININLDEMKSCLAQGFPFAFGLRLYSSFDQAAKTGVVPMPNTSDNGRESHASHALLAVGYSDQSRAFIVRNSWGENWGDQGYCYIPYDYLTNSNLCFDVWTVRKLAMDDFGQDHWDADDMINYLQYGSNDSFYNNLLGSSEGAVIEDSDDDDDDYGRNRNNYHGHKGNFDDPWKTYRSFERNNDTSNDYYGIYQNEDYKQQYNNFDNPYQAYGGDNYYGTYQNDNYDRRNSVDTPWNPYRAYGGYNYAKNEDNNLSRGPFGSNFFYPTNDPFQAQNSFLGYSNFDPFVNNGPDFSANPFTSPPSFNGYQQYGLSYGYSNSYNDYFDPYF